MDQAQQTPSHTNKHLPLSGWIRFLAFLAAGLLAFYFLVVPVWTSEPWKMDGGREFETPPGISSGQWMEQTFALHDGTLSSFSFIPLFMPFDHPQGSVVVSLRQGERELFSQKYDLADIGTGAPLPVTFPLPLRISGNKPLMVRMTNLAPDEMYVAMGYRSTGEGTVRYSGGEGMQMPGSLVVSFSGEMLHSFIPIAAGLAAVWLFALAFAVYQNARRAKGSLFWTAASELKKFRFLMKQLVLRDFNTKYRQSMLGVVWSFLNPLLTMVVQYIVFSTIFRADVRNYPVYLLTGIVLMNYFTEAVSLGMDSILSNARLITKVYIPKYIFPISKVLFSFLNLLISLIPLFIMVLITGESLRFSLLLMPLVLGMLFLFCLGMSFMMASANVFFRDTRFLWGVVSMLWLYLTPIFYPVTIIPETYRWVFHMNPMFQFITFMRIIIMDGVSPGINTYLGCFLSAVISMGIGLFVFRKSQNQFILHL